MITREGMETALLMNALLFTVQSPQIVSGAIGGTVLAAFIAWLWSRYGHRVNLARFFQVTAVFLLIFVVQLLIYGFHELTEANIFPNSQPWHDATEPFGPDGIYGQYLTYLLVAAAAHVARCFQLPPSRRVAPIAGGVGNAPKPVNVRPAMHAGSVSLGCVPGPASGAVRSD